MANHNSEGVPTLASRHLAPDIYRTRFEVHQTSVTNSALVILALVAFWFAIESGYAQYQDGLNDQKIATNSVNDSKAAVGLQERAGKQCWIKLAGQTPSIGPPPSSAIVTGAVRAHPGATLSSMESFDLCVAQVVDESKREQAAELKANQEKVADRKRELRRASVTLSIAGTNLPPRVILAAPVWLSALLAWLLYLDARLGSAHLNLAAYRDSLEPNERMFGSAGEGTIWLAPLRLMAPFEPLPVEREARRTLRQETRELIGWSRSVEHRYVAVIWTILLLISAISARMVWVGFDLTSASARDILGSSESTCRLLQALILFLATANAIYLARIGGIWTLLGRSWTIVKAKVTGRSLTSMEVDAAKEPPSASRRKVMIGGAVVTVIAIGSASIALLPRSGIIRGELPTPSPSAARKPRNRAPRFVPRAKKLARLTRIRVFDHPVAGAAPAPELYGYGVQGRSASASGSRRTSAVLAAPVAGEVRLFAPVVTLLVRIGHGQPLKYLGSGGRRNPAWSGPHYDPNRTNSFEVVALDWLKRLSDTSPPNSKGGNTAIEHACDLLLAGVALSLMGARRPALRLMDLLAGLTVRYNQPEHLLGLKAMLRDHRYAAVRTTWINVKAGAGDPDPVEARLKRWDDVGGAWHRDWTANAGGREKKWSLMSDHLPQKLRDMIVTGYKPRSQLPKVVVLLPLR